MIKLNLSTIYNNLRTRILSRTKSGYDKDNKPFIPYSKLYKKKKRGTVDLTLTGHMLNSLGISENEGISLNNSFAISKANYNANNGRLFMGLTKDDIKYVLTTVHLQIKSLLRKEFNTWNSK